MVGFIEIGFFSCKILVVEFIASNVEILLFPTMLEMKLLMVVDEILLVISTRFESVHIFI